jgi:hypothetical protein
VFTDIASIYKIEIKCTIIQSFVTPNSIYPGAVAIGGSHKAHNPIMVKKSSLQSQQQFQGNGAYGYSPIDMGDFSRVLSNQFPAIANPGPVGLGGFALTTFVLSMFNAGAIVGECCAYLPPFRYLFAA